MIVTYTLARARWWDSETWDLRALDDGAYDADSVARKAERILEIGGEAYEQETIGEARRLIEAATDEAAPELPLARRADHVAKAGAPRSLLDRPIDPGGTLFSDDRAGWPLRAFRSEMRFHMVYGPPDAHGLPTSVTPVTQTTWAWEVPWPPPRMRAWPAGLGWGVPYRPIWGGLLANSAIFGAVWWGVLTVPVWVRRRVRRGRGACLLCGYDLRGLGDGAVCPECGVER